MRYTPHTPSDQERMLRAIGLNQIEDLFQHVPPSMRNRAAVSLPPGLSELETKKRLAALAARNATPQDWHLFLGGGIYHHFIPSVVDAVISRSEFSTSYTPYQPEVSQGTLQAIYEFQTLICQLTGMEVANAGLYDGASATAEAVLMARRIQDRRSRVFLSRALHPQYRSVVATYLRNLKDVEIVEVPFSEEGGTDLGFLSKEMDVSAMCVLVGYPNYFGIVENLPAIREACTRTGAILITATTEPLSLALLKPPGDWQVDIAVGEGQSLGIPASLGGPGFGFFACRRNFVRAMPGRLVGETTDREGRRGFVLTLSTREQHIRREKATSNICTNQNLCTLAAAVYMSALGKTGMRRLAEVNVRRAHRVHDRLTREGGLKRKFAGSFFNEFVIEVPALGRQWGRWMADKIVPGIRLSPDYPDLQECLLVCVTEMNGEEEIDHLVQALARD